MKSFLIALFLCLIYFTSANANPNDDRYFRSAYVQDTIKAIKKQRYKKKTVLVKKFYRKQVSPKTYRASHTRRFLRDAANAATLPIRRLGAAVVLGVRPSGAPRAWCGFWLGRHLGMPDRKLWLARNWAGVGSAASPSPGAIVVWRHHVGRITAVDGHKIKVISGNDGNRVKERWRTMAGVIAVRKI